MGALAAEDKYQQYQAQVDGTNIDPVTLLATDYLNHLNEAVMMLEMVPADPDFLADAAAWQPKSYADHFRDSGLTYGELAVAAYAWSPPEYRGPFDDAVEAANECYLAGIKALRDALAAGEDTRVEGIVAATSVTVHELIDRAGGIINGHTGGPPEVEDAPAAPDDEAAGSMAQDAIDSLFD